MKNKLLLILSFIGLIISPNLYSQDTTKKSTQIRYDGLYVGKIKEIVFDNKPMELYLNMKFTDDGMVYTQTVSGYDPKGVAKWLGKNGHFERSGFVSIDQNNIIIKTDNEKSKDKNLEGPQISNYSGIIADKSTLKIKFENEESLKDSITLNFVQTADTLNIQFADADKKISLPGSWEIVKETAAQMVLKNQQSTLFSLSVSKKENFPTYKKGESNYESAFNYFKWESDYQKEKYKNIIKICKENKSKGYIIWSSESEEHKNKNMFLNGANADIFFVMLVADDNLKQEDQIKLLESIFEINR